MMVQIIVIVITSVYVGQRGSGKGRGSAGTLPYVIPCTADNGQTSDSSDGNDDKRVGEGGKVNIPKVCCTSPSCIT